MSCGVPVADTNRDTFHILLEIHAAAPKSGESDVAHCTWLRARFPGSEGWLEDHGPASVTSMDHTDST